MRLAALLFLPLVACGDDGSSLPIDARALDAARADASAGDAPIDSAPGAPDLPSTNFPDYTTFVDSGINIYWRDAHDDVTAQADLEYRMTYRPAGGNPTVGMDWRKPAQISHEAQNRMWTRIVPANGGVYELWISVRDAELNVADYPVLEATFANP
ncbi:MAG: hypothetical protein SFX73_30670 [Kofleriaceae bacterium]|nr:hypothetical protein [Kofleriaceae bacterium]